jgi:hypothetical protein
MHSPRLQTALRSLQSDPLIHVAFLLDQDGALLAWSGASPAFSPVGQFPPRRDELDENLYLTVLADVYYLGVLFGEGVPIEDVRALVHSKENVFLSSLGWQK